MAAKKTQTNPKQTEPALPTSTTDPNDLDFGLDLGFGGLKLTGPAASIQIPSQVAVDSGQAITDIAGFKKKVAPQCVRIDGSASFHVGLNAHDWGMKIESLDYDRLNGVPETKAILYAGLTLYMRQAGNLPNPIRLTVGLPQEPLAGPDKDTIIGSVRRWLTGTHTWLSDDRPYQVTVDAVKATSQPAGALFDYLLDETGQFIPARKPNFKKEIGVISVGFNTLEALALSNREVVPALTTGRTVGVRRLLEIIDPSHIYSLGELDSKLRLGTLEGVAEALPLWEREVTGILEKTWGNRWRGFAVVLLVGGGVELLKETLPYRFNGKAYVPEDPVMSIARGLRKLGRMQAGRG